MASPRDRITLRRIAESSWVRPFAFLILIIVLWDLTVRLFKIPPYLIPAPKDVTIAFWTEGDKLLAEAVPIIFDLLEHEGLCLGGSSGINVAGAVRLAKELGPGHIVVTVLADYGTRYQSELFNPEFLREKKLPVPSWLERRSSIRVPYV